MNVVVIPLLLACSLGVTLYRGAAVAFATVFLPVLLLISAVEPLPAPGVPDVTASTAVIYGIILGIVLRGGEPLGIRFNFVDAVILLLAGASIISGMLNEELYTGVALTGSQMLEWVIPYFLARAAFNSMEARQAALWSLVTCISIVAFFALIEFRLWPNCTSRVLQSLGLYTGRNEFAYARFGFFRAQVTFQHPIDMGNAALIVLALIPLLATATGVGLRNRYVRLGMAAALVTIVCSISFTTYVGLAACAAIFLTLWWVRISRALLVPGVLAMIVAGFLFTSYLINYDLGARLDEEESALQGSFYIRTLIVQRSWELVRTAGWFGYSVINESQLRLASVDNAYLLVAMVRGWVSLALWLLLPVGLAWRATRAFAAAEWPEQERALALAVASILGVMAAMYTVWFGFVYASMFLIMLGFAGTLIDMVRFADAAAPELDEAAMAAGTEGFELVGEPT